MCRLMPALLAAGPYALTALAVAVMVAGHPWTGCALMAASVAWGLALDLREAARRRKAREHLEREEAPWMQ